MADKRWELIHAYAIAQNKEHLGIFVTVAYQKRFAPEGLLNTPMEKLEKLIDELRNEWCKRCGIKKTSVPRKKTDDPGPTPILQTTLFQDVD